ncbi:MAG: LamG-like jellyroll fold domain-containing protein [Planctomycetota bacterium]
MAGSPAAFACDGCGGHAHSGGTSHGPGGALLSLNTGANSQNAFGPVSFIVIGDAETSVGNGRAEVMMPAVNALNPDFVVFPGDLVTDGGLAEWVDWEQQTSILGDRRLMVPGNHDRGPDGSVANWQNTFDWLPDSQVLNGQQGTDQIDYFVDRENVRIISIATDIPGEFGSSVPRAQAWFDEVMLDVANRNADADPTNDIDRVFAFSHKPITLEAGTQSGWWESLSGQSGTGGAAATAHLSGHWHLYQNSRPDPNTDTAEIVQGTGNGSFFEGPTQRNIWGFTRITVNGGDVITEYYGDLDGRDNGANFQLLDTTYLIQGGVVPRGEQAYYQFNVGAENQDSSLSSLSKRHELHFNGGASVVVDGARGGVLDLTGSGDYVDAKNLGEGNFAIVGDLTLELAVRLNGSPGSNSVLASFGRSEGALNGGVESRESGNYAYIFAINADGTLRLEWEHDGRVVETVNSTEAVSDLSQWNDLKVVRDHKTNGVQFFVNGEALGNRLYFTESASGAGAGSLYIGSLSGGAGDFNGWLDDLRILDIGNVNTAFDINDDDDIDTEDWLMFLANFGDASPTHGDFNGDGVSDLSDFALFQQAYADANPGAAALSVPEPTSLALLALGGLLVARRRR